ncbi:unnamed protein product [Xylocopa violacea]|uniref:Arrestin C-terminal-like domain-containing protein n=1 Tax=Xylocopa violacea TaxID=135666 RepID=A0ABP1N3L5_XYLVO
MPSLRTFSVEFERPSATYMPGEMVSGNILVNVAKEKRIRGISVSAKGEARVRWHEYRNETNVHGNTSDCTTYSNHEEYFHLKQYVLGSNSSTSQMNIPVGSHRYPFMFQLPYNIPSSFEHNNGHIRYVVKAVIDRPWAFNHECKVAFTVVSSLNLNEHRHECQYGIDDDVMQSFCCFCCIDQGKMNLHIRVPVSGYVPGQTIFVAVQYANSSSTVKITGISTKLMRKLKFRAGAPSSKEKTEKTEVKSTRDLGPFSTNGCSMLEFSVPPIPPSRLEYCSIIELDYELAVTAHVSGTHCKVERSYPLLIGTVPIYCPPSASSLDMNAVPTCSSSSTAGHAMMPMPMPTAPYPPTDFPVCDLPRLSVHSESIVVHPSKHTSVASPNWDIPPPTYEECTSGAENIMDHDESNYVYGANDPFTPRYPVFRYPAPTM